MEYLKTVVGVELWIHSFDTENRKQTTYWDFENENYSTKVLLTKSANKIIVGALLRKTRNSSKISLRSVDAD